MNRSSHAQNMQRYVNIFTSYDFAKKYLVATHQGKETHTISGQSASEEHDKKRDC